ncbi:MAG: uroporphyrinogen-III synthase [Planctomycetes bacterium]|nr:uroporphyrinogen-III synthase [Planctomycetota bacterium]
MIAITRPAGQSASLARHVAAAGADAFLLPLIVIEGPPDAAQLRQALQRLEDIDLVVFSSANAVRFVLDEIENGGCAPAHALARQIVAAMGEGTAAVLAERGLPGALVPAPAGVAGLVPLLAERVALAGARVLLPLGDRARRALPEALAAAGARVTEVTAYRTLPAPPAQAARLEEALLGGAIDVVTFASGSAVEGLAAALGAERSRACLARAGVAVLGDTAAAALTRLGVVADARARVRSDAGLCQAALGVAEARA